jgi:hypothetical protein
VSVVVDISEREAPENCSGRRERDHSMDERPPRSKAVLHLAVNKRLVSLPTCFSSNATRPRIQSSPGCSRNMRDIARYG